MGFLRKIALRILLKDFAVTERTLSDGEYAQAMIELSSPAIIKYRNIKIANLIRRHLYVKNMEDGSWYLGAIAMLRKEQSDSMNYRKSIEKQQDNLTEEIESVQVELDQ